MSRKSEPPSNLIVARPELPDDFPRRLEHFKRATGLTWDGLALCMGVAPRQIQRWRHGTKPSGDGLHALLSVAMRVRGGLAFFLGERVEHQSLKNPGRHPTRLGTAVRAMSAFSRNPLRLAKHVEWARRPALLF